MKPLYILRHNRAVLRIQRAMVHGSMGGSFTIMDASAATRLPVGVAGTRIPQWMLPDVAPLLLSKLRPDLLVVHGLSSSLAPALDVLALEPAALSVLQHGCVVHLVELGYTRESCYADTLAAKLAQHVDLLALLVSAGWCVSPASAGPLASPHVVLLGTSGTIFSGVIPVLSTLGVPPSRVPAVLHSLHVTAVRAADQIVRTRRRLEHSPAFRSFVFSGPDPP
jgi:hypothetical protein